MSIQERIQVILKMHHLTPSAFADKIGVQRSSISHVLSGRNKPGLDFLEKILIQFPRVNAHWLITGKISDVKTISDPQKEESTIKPPTSPVGHDNSNSEVKSDIERIMIFYKDGTFKAYQPNAE